MPNGRMTASALLEPCTVLSLAIESTEERNQPIRFERCACGLTVSLLQALTHLLTAPPMPKCANFLPLNDGYLTSPCLYARIE
jgi:hypothetical protein